MSDAWTPMHRPTEARQLEQGWEVRYERPGRSDWYEAIPDDAFQRLREKRSIVVVDEFTRPQPAA